MSQETLDDGPSCVVCKDLAPLHDVDPSELARSASVDGCLGCTLIQKALEAFDVDLSAPDLTIFIYEWDPGTCWRMLVDHPLLREMQLELFRLRGEPEILEAVSLATEVPGNTGSETSIARIRQWMTGCVNTHVCPSNMDVTLPNRVLDLSTVTADNQGTVRLRETNDERGTYVCLSHSWGREPLLRTLAANYDSHKAGIPCNLLPKTFLDAIRIARALGFTYLWIDSLCIIQDSAPDWERESALMGRIYQNSQITIAASNSTGAASGCFVDAFEYLSKELSVTGSNHTQYRARVRRHIDHGYWPLTRRGWVYQERLLSPRTLHFGHAEVVWECLAQLSCECAHIDDGNTQSLDFVLGKKNSRFQWTAADPSAPISNSGLDFWAAKWRDMVQLYSRLDLTFSSDILPALSGAAKQIQRHRGSKYLAGLWEDTLMEDLLWTTNDPRASRPAEWRSPTWSWASVFGVSYMTLKLAGQLKHRYAQLVGSESEPGGLDPTGQVRPGYIVLSGPVVAATLHWEQTWDHEEGGLPHDEYPMDEAGAPGLGYTGYHKLRVAGEKTFPSGPGRVDFYSDYEIGRAGSGYVPSGTPLSCLKVASAVQAQNGRCTMFYLVLRCVDEQARLFERVGLLEHWVPDDMPDGRFVESEDDATVKIV